jgi:hypothetical protein
VFNNNESTLNSVDLGKNASDTSALFSEAYDRDAMKSHVFLSAINGSNRTRMSKSHMKLVLITFFDIKGIHF